MRLGLAIVPQRPAQQSSEAREPGNMPDYHIYVQFLWQICVRYAEDARVAFSIAAMDARHGSDLR